MDKILRIAGAKEYSKFKKGEPISRKEAMLAQCYVCNGMEESRADCKGKSCPMYFWHPHREKKTP